MARLITDRTSEFSRTPRTLRPGGFGPTEGVAWYDFVLSIVVSVIALVVRFLYFLFFVVPVGLCRQAIIYFHESDEKAAIRARLRCSKIHPDHVSKCLDVPNVKSGNRPIIRNGIVISSGEKMLAIPGALVDTGASVSCIPASVAETLNLKTVGATSCVGVHGRRRAVDIVVAVVYIEDLTPRFCELVVLKDSRHMIIGCDFLEKCQLFYDGPKKLFHLVDGTKRGSQIGEFLRLASIGRDFRNRW